MDISAKLEKRFCGLLLSLLCLFAASARAAGDELCKQNFKKLDSVITPYVNISASNQETLRHVAWVKSEWVWAMEAGCNTSDREVQQEIQSIRSQVTDAVRTCRSITVAGTDCSPKQHFSASAYSRPAIGRSGAAVGDSGLVGGSVGAQGQSAAVPEQVSRSRVAAFQSRISGDEQARQKGRREHRQDLDAKDCLQLNPNTNMLRNACSYKIEVTYCALNPKPQNSNAFDVTWAFSCTEGRGRFGADTVGVGKDLFGLFPHRTDGGLFVAACREEFPKDVRFTGTQIEYRCRPI